MKKILQICCDSLPSATNTKIGGADRIELCENLAQGGVSPSAGIIILAKKYLKIPVFVLIRPRKGDFFYNGLEVECMLENIRQAKKLGADGIVSGALLKDGGIDLETTERLIEATRPLPFTFHRAFDRCLDPFQALNELKQLRVNRILTSGQAVNAQAGISMLKDLIKTADEDITIMAAGSIRPANIAILSKVEGLTEFHSAASKKVNSAVTFYGKVPMGSEALDSEYSWFEVDEEMVRAMKKQLL